MALEWNDAQIADLKDRYAKGQSAAEIARGMSPHGHLSRAAVIGKLHRLKMIRQESAESKALQKPKPDPRGQSLGSLDSLNGGRPVATPLPAVRDDVLTDEDRLFAKPWTERELTQCKWPFLVGGETLSCCRPVRRGGYCEGHALKALVSSPPTGKRSAKALIHELRRYA